MFDDFLLRGLFGGIGVAIVAGALGCFIVWQRMSYSGAVIAHAVLGVIVAFGLFLLARAFASPKWRKPGSEP